MKISTKVRVIVEKKFGKTKRLCTTLKDICLSSGKISAKRSNKLRKIVTRVFALDYFTYTLVTCEIILALDTSFTCT